MPVVNLGLMSGVTKPYNPPSTPDIPVVSEAEPDINSGASASDVTAGTQNIGASDWDNQYFNSQQAKIYRDWSAKEAAKQRSYNSVEAQKSRDWTERMANSAYQRARDDMIKAGLNPYLAYGQGGAATPSAAQASASIASGASASYSGVNSASARSLMEAETLLTSMRVFHEFLKTIATGKDIVFNWNFGKRK